ncbi:MAG: T9SS type A sorting domain-containing protein [Candidatus Eisenbacteria bacterium]|nr:T9SS type A sorting domain-containing protein [Candidatus Eisenbacteria bacterium]
MKKLVVVSLVLVVAILATAAVAGAKEIERKVPVIDEAVGVVPMGHVFGLNAAMAGTDTFYYGGTVIAGGDTFAAAPAAPGWANRKMWTWSPGGFNGTPHSGLNMDGWRGVDLTDQAEDYMHVVSDTSSNPYLNIGTCVRSGHKSLFCGVTSQQAYDLCYVNHTGTGYGNNMYQTVVTGSYTYASGDNITLAYDYHNESEAGFDYGYCILQIYDTGASEWVDYDTMATYDDVVSGSESIDVDLHLASLTPPVDFRIAFNFDSDGGYSDQDGYNPTTCGGLEIDDYALTINSAVDSENFEVVADGGLPSGWAHYYAGYGDYAHVKHINDLPILPNQDVCYAWIGSEWCGIADSVLVFYDENHLTYPHPLYQNNFAYSPVIDFSDHPGLAGKLMTCERFGYSPLAMYIFFVFETRYAPACESGGWSRWLSDGYVYYTGETATCRAVTFDLSTLIPPSAEKAQIAYGVVNYCEEAMDEPVCSYTCNVTPYFDNVSFGLYGSDVAPYISMRELDYFQDQFAEDGTLNPASTADTRVAGYLGDYLLNPPIFGDTMVCHGGADNMEVWLTFRMAAVGPQQPVTHAFFTTWFPTATAGAWQSARMDTARVTASPTTTTTVAKTWMTAFHEADPVRIANGLAEGTEILPNNLFVPGTRIEFFLKARYTGSGDWFLLPDTAGGVAEEFEILPMYRDDGEGGVQWPCLIVADHFGRRGNAGLRNSDRIGQHLTANGFYYDTFSKLGPTSDLRNGIGRWAANAGQVGGPGTDKYNWGPGATLNQMLAYTHCMLNAGTQLNYSMYQQDVNLINSWLVTYSNIDTPRFFWMSGDCVARNLYNNSTWGRPFLNNILGATSLYSNYASKTSDYTYCLPVRGVAGGALPDTTLFVARTNGCLSTFNVIGLSGSAPNAKTERKYDSQATIRYAVVSNAVSVVGGPSYQTLTEGYDNCVIRTDGSLGYPLCGNDNVMTGWFATVLGWANYSASSWCDPSLVDVDPISGTPPAVRTSLAQAYPNPMNPTATIWYTVGAPGKVSLKVFDVSGRVIRTLVEKAEATGRHSVIWDGTTDRGEKVASGVFFYQLNAPGYSGAKKIVVLQ